MKKILIIVFIVALSQFVLFGDSVHGMTICMKVDKEQQLLPTSDFIDNYNILKDSANVAYLIRGRWYPYPDTIRYSYANKGMNIGTFGSNDFYAGDTVTINITIHTLKDSIYFDVNNNLPDSISFRIYKYLDFDLTESEMDSVSTVGLTFIYRGKNDWSGSAPTELDSNNFYIKQDKKYSIFYDIVGLDSGIYEILPTFTIFPVDSQEYGYKELYIQKRRMSSKSSIDSVYSRTTLPIYIREKAGWIDSVNVYLSDAVRHTLANNIDSAMFYNELALNLYPGSTNALMVRGWIYSWFFRFTIGNQINLLHNNMQDWEKDWYLIRFGEINSGLYYEGGHYDR
jgi:hypothetical protein